ncbi:uncharacterized protein LOC101239809 isoform X2 [Hydra vulgaris]|uniref:uncharacterized protein LOC101239809 isoform X2 n=1 Tax=Hydra vulgaris TaxID=6087 RepID=UPI001F5EC6F4|nr:uncharacterized protein LOC101239809 isoform X2 [Hydra vulgaris]
MMTKKTSNKASVITKAAFVLINLNKQKKKRDMNKDMKFNNESQAFILYQTAVGFNDITYQLDESFEDYLVVSVLKAQHHIGEDIETEDSIIEMSDEVTIDTEDSAPFLNKGNIQVPGWLFLKNKSIAEYCVELLNSRKIISHNLEKNKTVIDSSSECKYKSLGEILSNFDSFLRLNVNWNWIAGTRNLDSLGLNAFLFYVEKLIEIEKVKDKVRFIKDSKMFLQIYTSRPGKTDVLNHSDYWGSSQQLLSGKVIADFVAGEYGTLHPVFGVLLNPTTGRVGPGDTGLMHNFLFDYNGPWANHAAVHDAFGYLKTFHNIGPGYNYLGGISAVKTGKCMAGQTSGLLFWNRIINQHKVNQ